MTLKIVSSGLSFTIAALDSHNSAAIAGSYESFDVGTSRVPMKYFPDIRSNLGSVTMLASALPDRATLFTFGTNGRNAGKTKRHANRATLP